MEKVARDILTDPVRISVGTVGEVSELLIPMSQSAGSLWLRFAGLRGLVCKRRWEIGILGERQCESTRASSAR